MKIILLRDIRGLGRTNDIREVSDGYARNFLISKGFAAAITPEALAKKEAASAHEAARMEKLRTQAAAISNETFEFSAKGEEGGNLFGSVSEEQITNAFRVAGYAEASPVLERPIKRAGEYMIEVRFPCGVKSTVRVVVSVAK